MSRGWRISRYSAFVEDEMKLKIPGTGGVDQVM